MLVSLSPRATQQLLVRSATRVGFALNPGVGPKLAAPAATRLFYSTCTRARPSVIPSLRKQRPKVRGEAVAFHVSDLDSHSGKASLAHQAAAAYDDFDDYEPQRQYDSDLVVVLDMDECLIHSQFLTNNPGAKFYAHQVARNAAASNNGKTERVDSFRFHLPDGDLVHVNKRPFLEEFLQAVTEKYETHIFTAAMQVYAEPILNHLDPNGDRFARRWYRESCDLDANLGAYVKNLGSLPLAEKTPHTNGSFYSYDEYMKRSAAASSSASATTNLRRVVLVDNNPLSFLANPTNGILVSSFYNDPTDKTLPAVMELLQELEPLDDVRPTLDARFGLKAALSEIQGNKTTSPAARQSNLVGQQQQSSSSK